MAGPTRKLYEDDFGPWSNLFLARKETVYPPSETGTFSSSKIRSAFLISAWGVGVPGSYSGSAAHTHVRGGISRPGGGLGLQGTQDGIDARVDSAAFMPRFKPSTRRCPSSHATVCARHSDPLGRDDKFTIIEKLGI